MTKERLYTKHELQQIIRRRVRKLTQQVEDLEVENAILRNLLIEGNGKQSKSED